MIDKQSFFFSIVIMILMFAFDANCVQCKSHLIEAVLRYFQIT